MGFNGKVAIVTGAGSGLGAVTAAALAREGATVVLCGRRESKLADVKRGIEEERGTALAIRCDVSDQDDVNRLVRETLERFGRIDLLVNNAAVFDPGDVLETTLDAWNYQLSINLTGPFLLIRACLPTMRAQKYGRIVNVTSALAANGSGGFAAYSASKAGLEALTRTVADDESGHHITARLFNPGAIKTEMHATGRPPQTVVPELLRLLEDDLGNRPLYVDAAGGI